MSSDDRPMLRSPGVRTLVAYPAEHEREPDASAMFRALAHHDGVPEEHRPSDNEPLRNCLPGIWPTVGDLRATLSGQPSTPSAASGLVDAVREPLSPETIETAARRMCSAVGDDPDELTGVVLTYRDGTKDHDKYDRRWKLWAPKAEHELRVAATLSGQQGGAVLAGDLPSVEAIAAALFETDDTLNPGKYYTWVSYNPKKQSFRSHADVVQDRVRERAAEIRARLAEQPAQAGTGDADPAALYARRVKIAYTNWRGEFGQREIAPIRLIWGSNEWHPEPQWLIEAWDLGKSEIRTFALSGIGGTGADGVEGLRKAAETVWSAYEDLRYPDVTSIRLLEAIVALGAALNQREG